MSYHLHQYYKLQNRLPKSKQGVPITVYLQFLKRVFFDHGEYLLILLLYLIYVRTLLLANVVLSVPHLQLLDVESFQTLKADSLLEILVVQVC